MADDTLPTAAELEQAVNAPAAQLPSQPEGLAFASAITKVKGTVKPASIAILGKFKVGKTTLAASASEIKPLKKAGKEVLILEAEKGTASIADDYPDVSMLGVTNFFGLNRAIDELLTKEHNFGVCVFDTFDRMVDWAVTAIVDPATDTRKAWGSLKAWINDTTWRLHNAGILAIFLFHEENEKDERTGAITTTFKLPGSAKNDLGQVYDIIGRLTVKKLESDGQYHRVLQLGPAEGQITGNRYEKKLPNSMVDPTLEKVFDLILGTTTSTTTINN